MSDYHLLSFPKRYVWTQCCFPNGSLMLSVADIPIAGVHFTYAYDNLEEFKMILCCSEGTRFANMIDEMVDIEIKGTHDYQAVLEKLGYHSPLIDPRLEHILITGMFNAFFELIIHEMPLHEAEEYLIELREFYTAGWMKIMGQ